MTELVVDTEGVLAYGAMAATMAEQVASAGAAAAACGPAVLAPVLGLIGTEFLAAFGRVHLAHTDAVVRLSHVLSTLGGAAAASAVSYALTDAATGSSVSATTGNSTDGVSSS